MKLKTINLHIDRIVLDGVGHLNHGQLSLAIERELHRLISIQGLRGLSNQSTVIRQITAKPIVLSTSIKDRNLGNKIANTVYRWIKQ